MAVGQDSFDPYGTPQIYWRWTVPVNFSGTGYAYSDTAKIVAAAGRCGTNGLVVQPAAPVIDGCGPHLTVAPGSNSGVIGFAARAFSFLNNAWLCKIKYLGTGDANTQIGVLVRTDGALQVTRGGGDCSLVHSAPTILGTGIAGSAIHQNVYYFFELVFTIHTSAGSVQLWQNGIKIIDVSGVNTAGQGTSAWNGIELGRSATSGGAPGIYPNGPWLTFDDFYWLDTTDAAPLNARLGDVKVAMKMPTADGDLHQWTPKTGVNHYAMVNEIPPDGDTSYNSDGTAGDVDTFTYPALDIASGTIYWLSVVPAAAKDDSGFKEISTVTRIAGTTYVNAQVDAPSLTDYKYFPQNFLVNPATAAGWTVADVNGAQPGYKVIV